MSSIFDNEGFTKLLTEASMTCGAFITIVWRFISWNYKGNIKDLSYELKECAKNVKCLAEIINREERDILELTRRINNLEFKLKTDEAQFPRTRQID